MTSRSTGRLAGSDSDYVGNASKVRTEGSLPNMIYKVIPTRWRYTEKKITRRWRDKEKYNGDCDKEKQSNWEEE